MLIVLGTNPVNNSIRLHQVLLTERRASTPWQDRYHRTGNEIEPEAKGEGKTGIPIQTSICVPKLINSSE